MFSQKYTISEVVNVCAALQEVYDLLLLQKKIIQQKYRNHQKKTLGFQSNVYLLENFFPLEQNFRCCSLHLMLQPTNVFKNVADKIHPVQCKAVQF